MSFGSPDRIPLSPGEPRESTLAAWHGQGLPENMHWYTCLADQLGIPDCAGTGESDLGVNFKLQPAFAEKVLAHQGGHYIVQDWMGAVVEISDQYDYTYLRAAKDFVTRKWHSFPVVSRADWERENPLALRPGYPGRFPADFATALRQLPRRDYPLRLDFNGPFWQMREWCGFEGLCLLMAENPEFVEEMADFWTRVRARSP